MPTTDTKPLWEIVNIEEEVVGEKDVRVKYRQGGYDPRSPNRFLAHVDIHAFFDRNDIKLYWLSDSDYVEMSSCREMDVMDPRVPAFD